MDFWKIKKKLKNKKILWKSVEFVKEKKAKLEVKFRFRILRILFFLYCVI